MEPKPHHHRDPEELEEVMFNGRDERDPVTLTKAELREAASLGLVQQRPDGKWELSAEGYANAKGYAKAAKMSG